MYWCVTICDGCDGILYIVNIVTIVTTVTERMVIMENKTIFDKLGVQYEEKDGLFYPCISISEEQVDVGKYGLLWMEYMKEEHPGRYMSLRRHCGLRGKAAEINEEAYKMLDSTMKRYLLQHKPENMSSTMEMWRVREEAKMVAEEMILNAFVMQFH